MRLLIYTAHSSPRTGYIFSTMLAAAGFQDWSATENIEEYISFSGAKINYSATPLTEKECWIIPTGLLVETNIQPQNTVCQDWKEIKIFFSTSTGDLPFDIFSASFYLLTRYEEYLPHTLDMYGRFAHENSIAFTEKFLQLPLINLWIIELQKLLQLKFPALQLHPQSFQFIPTYDIDIAWSYLHKGLKRNAGAALRSLAKAEMESVKERQDVLLKKKSDPFDSYKWLDELHKINNLEPIYFFLLAQKNKEYDKNILPSKVAFQQLIKEHGEKYALGIHPSWQSGDDKNLLKEEKNILESLTAKPVTKSRHHYIRMTLPETYRELLDAGIQEDYSMGYGSINGFRASYCLPFYWYDLQKEETTSLFIYPFCFMDANSFYEQKYSTEQTVMELGHYADTVKNVNGTLITIWHNHFLGSDKMFALWKEVYEGFIKLVCSNKLG